TFKIYQIYFAESQKSGLSIEFTPFLNAVKDDFYEFGVFYRAFTQGLHKEQSLTGFLSWRFERKSYLSANDLLDLIKNNPGYDSYHINPFPELSTLYQNVWVQGAASHPGLLTLGQRIFDHLGIKSHALLQLLGRDDKVLGPVHGFLSACL
ncbi:MAG: hypothetical protein NTV34_01190, partial [Proteobacteria bacterium]|nr:hypothetical protein [Pseudomonadota bacterium]